MPKKSTAADAGQIKVRLPATLRRQLERASDKSGRSLNNEILWRLMRSFEAPEPQNAEAAMLEQTQVMAQMMNEMLEGKLRELGLTREQAVADMKKAKEGKQ